MGRRRGRPEITETPDKTLQRLDKTLDEAILRVLDRSLERAQAVIKENEEKQKEAEDAQKEKEWLAQEKERERREEDRWW